ncbi:MAG: hypothetical protein SFV51_05440 [Bryobacteraceae bacterium]|nr:hypothetical protein [Bryobacteraceae bacterium]
MHKARCSTLFVLVCLGPLSAQINLNRAPSRVIGHPQLQVVSGNPNYVEGREMFNPSAVAVDTSASPPIVYVSDTGNNRVLAWRNAASFENGVPADVIIGQRDPFSTLPQGPGTSGGLTTGLAFPTGIAVDRQGNLYVADSGNNRILRYPQPLAQGDELKLPDMAIGQANFNSNRPNPEGVTAQSVALNLGGSRVFRVGLFFDPSGNLWLSDSGNHRVLRYPAAALARGANAPAADVVVGQFNFTSNQSNRGDRNNKTAMSEPAGITMDGAGRLYVCDALNRVMVYTNPVTGASAARIMGIKVPQEGEPTPPAVNDTSLGVSGRPPESVFILGSTPFVVDTGANRIVRYDPFESWPGEGAAFSPPGRQFIGQADALASKENRARPEPSNAGFDSPVFATVANNEVWVVDAGNHRVLVFPVQGGSISTATRVLGQADFFQSAPNYIEGRDLFLFNGFVSVGSGRASDGSGIVVDNTSSPPRLYVADTYNHRILGFANAYTVRQGQVADLVIGQRGFRRSIVNDPSGDPDQPNDTGLLLPAGLALDAAGNLYVADSGNGRVLRFPRPFEQEGPPKPDLVLGQTGFFNKIPDATSRTMARPFGLAFSVDGDLAVSDAQHNRVLLFRRPPGGDFSNGQQADRVVGQADFSSVIGSNAPNRMISPRQIALDTDDRLYVCDTGNNRVLIYDRITAPLGFADPSPALTLAGSAIVNPQGIFVSKKTGEIWIANTGRNELLRLPIFQLLVFDPTSNYSIPAGTPLAIAQDESGSLFVAEGINRISFFFPGMQTLNDANRLFRFAPGAHALVRPVTGASFAAASDAAPEGADAYPTTMQDLEVTVADLPAPIKSVGLEEIRFIIPYGVTPGSIAEVLVTRRSSGQIVASGLIPVAAVAPAFFTSDGTGRAQVMAINEADGKANAPVDKVGRSQIIHLFGTGLGVVPNAPPEGQKVPDKIPADSEVRVAIGAAFVPQENILYHGLAPGMIGVWMLSVKVPDAVAPEDQVPIAATVNSVPTNQDGVGGRVQTFIAVKP